MNASRNTNGPNLPEVAEFFEGPGSDVDPVEKALAIESRIRQRTWVPIPDLNVEVTEDRVVVRGSASSCSLKQMAVQAILDALDSVDSDLVDVDIQVVCDDSPSRR
jgi:hypothetical protein